MADDGLKRAVRKWREGDGIDVRPASAYEAVTREMVEALRSELAEIKGRLNGLLFMVAGAILIDVLLRLAAVGS